VREPLTTVTMYGYDAAVFFGGQFSTYNRDSKQQNSVNLLRILTF